MSSTYVGMAIWIIAALVAISTRRAWVRASVIVMMATWSLVFSSVGVGMIHRTIEYPRSLVEDLTRTRADVWTDCGLDPLP